MKRIFSIFFVLVSLFISSVSYASDIDNVNINQAYRVYDKYTGELILSCAFEPVFVKGCDFEYVLLTVCDMHGDCAAYEFENRLILEKIDPKDIVK